MKASLLSIFALLSPQGAVTPGAPAAPAAPVPTPERPNVLFILADDLGWSDTTLYGGTRLYETPNLARLAESGMLFTRAYAASSVCSPTRASLMTGLSPARTGITRPAGHEPLVILAPERPARMPPGYEVIPPISVTRLRREYVTLAESLAGAGYATGHFGKWHLGAEPYSPREQGFAVDVPHWDRSGPGSYLAPWPFPELVAEKEGEHVEERMAAEAVAFLEQHKDEPFFLNYWMFSVHPPFQARPELVERYRARLDPADAQRSPTYAAMVASLDAAVGTLLDALERLGLAEKTIVVFTSDNGGNESDELEGTTPTSNRPLRGGKGSIWEGGLRVPCVVRWPGVVTGGARSEALVQSTDFYPTLLEMLGLEPAEGQRFDGVSVVPALRGQPFERAPLFTYLPQYGLAGDALPPCVAVHQDDWKLIRVFHAGAGDAHRWLLFDLAADPGERNDLAAREPERVKAMDALIERHLTDTGAIVPVPNPRFDPAQQSEDGGGPEHGERARAAELHGWSVRRGTATVGEGVLVVEGRGQEVFLARSSAAGRGGTFVLRVRCTAQGEGKIEGRVAGAEAVTVPFVVRGGEWQELEVELAGEGFGALRVYLPAREQAVEVDWIEVRGGGETVRWDF